MIDKSAIWIHHLDETLDSVYELDDLNGKSILITGAGGLIGSALIDLIVRYNEKNSAKINIIAAGRDRTRIYKRFFPYCEKDYFKIFLFDALKNSLSSDLYCNYIINGAGNADPLKISAEPVETLMANLNGQKQLLEFAYKQDVSRVLYISSSEVYGKSIVEKPFAEDDYGYVDQLNPRGSYAIGKRAAENLCISYCTEYGVDTVIVRPGHIYGPTASSADSRVSSAWAYAAACGKNIVMKSDGLSIRSYCYCLDCATAIIKVLTKGESAHAYNVSNPQSVISIREMAEMLAEAGGVKVIKEMPDKMERLAFNPMLNSSLDSSRLQQLGWKGLFDAKRGLSNTVGIIRELINYKVE